LTRVCAKSADLGALRKVDILEVRVFGIEFAATPSKLADDSRKLINHREIVNCRIATHWYYTNYLIQN
jgi:hypothetical protein